MVLIYSCWMKNQILKIVNKNEVIDFCDNTKGVDQVNLFLEKEIRYEI